MAITCNIWIQIALRRFYVSNLVLRASQISVGISLHLLELNLVKLITVNFTFHISLNTIVKKIGWPVSMTRLQNDLTYIVSGGMLNPSHSLTHPLYQWRAHVIFYTLVYSLA